jgi:hypothetical protein
LFSETGADDEDAPAQVGRMQSAFFACRRAADGDTLQESLRRRIASALRLLRTAMYTDSIEQLRGTAGARQVRVRAETALAVGCAPTAAVRGTAVDSRGSSTRSGRSTPLRVI